MLRHLQPRQYLEVGSGFTTVLALDINELFSDDRFSITAIDPHPQLLRSLVRPSDDIEVLAKPVQSVPIERFAALGANDVLFIDSSHMLKTGSDVHCLVTEVLPILSVGVYVHFHDIFWPFEYPRKWVEKGVAWNEGYLLHAFLLFNQDFEIALWNHWLGEKYTELVMTELPSMLENTGGSLWLRRAA